MKASLVLSEMLVDVGEGGDQITIFFVIFATAHLKAQGRVGFS